MKDGLGYDIKNLTSTVKHGGGSIMIWGCFLEKGFGNIYTIEGKIDSYKYSTIFNDNLFKTALDFN